MGRPSVLPAISGQVVVGAVIGKDEQDVGSFGCKTPNWDKSKEEKKGESRLHFQGIRDSPADAQPCNQGLLSRGQATSLSPCANRKNPLFRLLTATFPTGSTRFSTQNSFMKAKLILLLALFTVGSPFRRRALAFAATTWFATRPASSVVVGLMRKKKSPFPLPGRKRTTADKKGNWMIKLGKLKANASPPPSASKERT